MKSLGNSGCGIIYIEGEDLVIKHTNRKFSPERLAVQEYKQKTFENSPLLQAPKIHAGFHVGTERFIIMDRVHGLDAIPFFEGCHKHAFKNAVSGIFNYINQSIKRSQVITVQPDVFTDKFFHVMSKCPKAVVDRVKAFSGGWLPQEPIDILQGPCHGDLTLCNMIFDNDMTWPTVWLVDFLDPFVSSPMQDIAKLRQDTYHGWITHMTEEDISPQAQSLLVQLDDKILNEFGTTMDNYQYDLFQFMNLVRILPYAKDGKVVDFVIEEIQTI